MNKVAFVLLLIASSLFSDAQRAQVPTFQAYSVQEAFHGRPVAPDLSSHPDARQFRTNLRRGATEGPNFADHYTVVEWHCGSPCHTFAIVDARSGRVYFPDVPAAQFGFEYHRNSRLFVADPPRSWREYYGADTVDNSGYAHAHYFRWDGTRMILVDSVAITSALLRQLPNER